MKKSVFLSTVPFAGFYQSVHDEAFDAEIESALYEVPCDKLKSDLVDLAYSVAAFAEARLEYAKAYAASLCDWLGLDGTFESIESPRFYNYETDRIFVNLTRDDVSRLWRGVDRSTFEKACRDRFTSRSGFISSYSPDWRDWGPLSTWDHNQIGTLLGAYAETEQGSAFDQFSEHELMETFLCNGGMHNALWSESKSDRFWKIVNYITARRERA